jgi:hypothetical protein
MIFEERAEKEEENIVAKILCFIEGIYHCTFICVTVL